jgi:hypothetical protein
MSRENQRYCPTIASTLTRGTWAQAHTTVAQAPPLLLHMGLQLHQGMELQQCMALILTTGRRVCPALRRPTHTTAATIITHLHFLGATTIIGLLMTTITPITTDPRLLVLL